LIISVLISGVILMMMYFMCIIMDQSVFSDTGNS